MTRNSLPAGTGLTSLTPGVISDLGLVETWRPRRIAIAGVRFQSGGDTTLAGGGAEGKGGDDAATKAAADKQAADDKAVADAAAAEANKGKTAEQIAAEKKAADDAAAAEAAKGGKGKDGDKPKAPDAYTLKVPDDAKDLIHPSALKRIEAIAREADLTNEEAQAFLNDQIESTAATLKTQAEEFLAVTKADPEYGGDKLEETTKLARRGVDGVFPVGHKHRDGFLQLLNRSGVGNKIEVVAFLATIGKQMTEDTPNLGGGKHKEADIKSDADALFPSTAAKT